MLFHPVLMSPTSIASLAWETLTTDFGAQAAPYRTRAAAQASEVVVKGLETIDTTLFHAGKLAVPAGFFACKVLFSSLLMPVNVMAWRNAVQQGKPFQWLSSDGMAEFVIGSMTGLSIQERTVQLQAELTRRALAVFSPFADAANPTDPSLSLLRTNLTILQQRLDLMEPSDTPPIVN